MNNTNYFILGMLTTDKREALFLVVTQIEFTDTVPRLWQKLEISEPSELRVGTRKPTRIDTPYSLRIKLCLYWVLRLFEWFSLQTWRKPHFNINSALLADKIAEKLLVGWLTYRSKILASFKTFPRFMYADEKRRYKLTSPLKTRSRKYLPSRKFGSRVTAFSKWWIANHISPWALNTQPKIICKL